MYFLLTFFEFGTDTAYVEMGWIWEPQPANPFRQGAAAKPEAPAFLFIISLAIPAAAGASQTPRKG
ncbi:hypothetical protein B5E67_00240 [Faecalibacterium sp. An122]|nr:hypothetical protein B5E67_00240 [Faecalibacterium sp. An122]